MSIPSETPTPLERFPVTVERLGSSIQLSVPALSQQDAIERVHGDTHSSHQKLTTVCRPGSGRKEGDEGC
jgi:hypothetical protein